MICKGCGGQIFSSDPEADFCERCEDIAIERSMKSQDWRHWEGCACPEIELPQYPQRTTEEQS